MPSCCFKKRVQGVREILERAPIIQESQIEHIKGAPDKVNQLYETCRKEQPAKSKEYCARVAWTVYNKMSRSR